MYAVVTMLNNSSSQIRAPKRPVFDGMTTEPSSLREATSRSKFKANSAGKA